MSENFAEKFKREMQKLGLGVSIQINGEPAVAVTTYCEKHGVSPGDSCAECERTDA